MTPNRGRCASAGCSVRLRLADVRTSLRALGMVITCDTTTSGPTGSGEYRVAFAQGRWPGLTKPRAEETAYYTPDLTDAFATGQTMARLGPDRR